MDFCSLYAPRLQEERKRLGLSQDAAGSMCGVSREMWGKYERGKAAIASEALACFAKAGANIEYILTGERAATVLTPDEQVLLDGYRALDPATRRRMLAFMLGGGEPSPSVSDKYRGAKIGGVTEGDFTGTAHIQVGGKERK